MSTISSIHTRIDIFCRIVDNYGDAGFVYRFAREYLRHVPSAAIRIFCDEPAVMQKMSPHLFVSDISSRRSGISLYDMNEITGQNMPHVMTAPVIVEAFGTTLPPAYEKIALRDSSLCINLEHLMADRWVEDVHAKESLITSPRMKKFFFHPGFTVKTGGLILDSGLPHRPESAEKEIPDLYATLLQSVFQPPDNLSHRRNITLFTYEHDFSDMVEQCDCSAVPLLFWVMGEKAAASIDWLSRKNGGLKRLAENHYCSGRHDFIILPFLPQEDFDVLIAAADINIVRGEDSWARAVLAGKPIIWDAYEQANGLHMEKVRSFLDICRTFWTNGDDFKYFNTLHDSFNRNKGMSKHCVVESYGRLFGQPPLFEQPMRLLADYLHAKCSLIDNFLDFVASKTAG